MFTIFLLFRFVPILSASLLQDCKVSYDCTIFKNKHKTKPIQENLAHKWEQSPVDGSRNLMAPFHYQSDMKDP